MTDLDEAVERLWAAIPAGQFGFGQSEEDIRTVLDALAFSEGEAQGWKARAKAAEADAREAIKSLARSHEQQIALQARITEALAWHDPAYEGEFAKGEPYAQGYLMAKRNYRRILSTPSKEESK